MQHNFLNLAALMFKAANYRQQSNAERIKATWPVAQASFHTKVVTFLKGRCEHFYILWKVADPGTYM